MIRRKELVLRAKLIGAYRRRDDLAARTLLLDDVNARIAELERAASAELMAEARRLSQPAGEPLTP